MDTYHLFCGNFGLFKCIQVLVLRKWVVLFIASDSTIFRSSVPIPVQSDLFLFPLSHIKTNNGILPVWTSTPRCFWCWRIPSARASASPSRSILTWPAWSRVPANIRHTNTRGVT